MTKNFKLVQKTKSKVFSNVDGTQSCAQRQKKLENQIQIQCSQHYLSPIPGNCVMKDHHDTYVEIMFCDEKYSWKSSTTATTFSLPMMKIVARYFLGVVSVDIDKSQILSNSTKEKYKY